ncbi:MAG TPA: NBR1-Ig-like domain-containing protein [Anaerolineales bacterium]|nr:NBR1-Ig-like domain-containing protein [Anaerolineales bacterium]
MINSRLMNAIKPIILILAFLLASCGSREPEPTPTLSPEQIQTQAVETFSALLTQTALAAPTDTPFPTLTASPTFAPFSTSTAGTPFTQPTVAPTSSCYSLRFVRDVTIPDNTPMNPGQTFTKTWRVFNAGTCAWEAGFKFTFTGGNALNGATYTLPSTVPPNTEIDISIAMTAPTTPGTYRSNWRMSTAGGQLFGDEVYVIIVVGNVTTIPTTTTPTSTSAPPTSTPEPTATTP